MNNFYVELGKLIACFVIICFCFLPIVIAARRNKKEMLELQTETNYIMRLQQSFLGVSIPAVGVGCFVLCAYVYIYEYKWDWGAIIGFAIYTLLEEGFSIYTIRWKMVIDDGLMTIYSLFSVVKMYNIDEISIVRISELQGKYFRGIKILKVYCGKKKIFEVNERMKGCGLLYKMFLEAGKIEPLQIKEEFTVSNKFEDIFASLFGVLLFGGCLIAVCIEWILSIEEVNLGMLIILIVFTVVSAVSLINELLWKITVIKNLIYIRSEFGRKKVFLIQQITRALEDEYNLFLFVGEKQIAKVDKNCKNYRFLSDRILGEGITIYRKC